ncbi:lipopolysaccharide biosynthesis protein [Prosthecobacter sp.]|uniref:lipopolysaccharide biosynthesis protein n=1 Tax=Prosthecobacter sp. TaxID=1965333 RepID=UPI003784776C
MISWLSHRRNRSRLFRWSTILSGFAVVQLLVQALNAVSGFLVVRTLEKPDYAWFTIASGMSATLAILSDSGVGIAVTSIGGTIWQDNASMKALVQAAMRMRLKLAAIASVVVAGISLWLLLSNGAGFVSALGLTILVLAPIWQISSTAVLNVVNRLHTRTRQLQVADLVPAVVRASLTGALVLLGGLSPLTAMAAVLAAHILQYSIVRRQVLPLLDVVPYPGGIEAYTARIWKMVLQLMPSSTFWCLQGQLTTWLISVFATTSEVADLGALNRLSIVYAVFGGPLGQYILPAFARTENRRRLWLMTLALLAGTFFFSGLLLTAAWLKGDWFLWLLGARYAHLHQELLLVLTGIAISTLSGIVWALNNTRAWIRRIWLTIPVTLISQAAAAFLFDLSTVKGVAGFIIATGAVQCCHALIVCCLGLVYPKSVHAG